MDPKFTILFLLVLGFIAYAEYLKLANPRWLEGTIIGGDVKSVSDGKVVHTWQLKLETGEILQIQNSNIWWHGKLWREVAAINNQLHDGARVKLRVVGVRTEWLFIYPDIVGVEVQEV